jgi:hypothetical protein
MLEVPEEIEIEPGARAEDDWALAGVPERRVVKLNEYRARASQRASVGDVRQQRLLNGKHRIA